MAKVRNLHDANQKIEIVLENYEVNKIVKDGQKILWYGNDMKLYNKKSVDIAEEGCKAGMT